MPLAYRCQNSPPGKSSIASGPSFKGFTALFQLERKKTKRTRRPRHLTVCDLAESGLRQRHERKCAIGDIPGA
eukprot:2663941-Rhodomonas_salina.1